CGDKRQGQGHTQRTDVDRDAERACDLDLGEIGPQRAERRCREWYADECPDPGEDDTFGEHLSNQAAARRAERRANCHLALASSRPYEEQVANVDAGDE